MLEKSKLRKKYPLFTDYINDSKLIKKLLVDYHFECLYIDMFWYSKLVRFIKQLEQLYSPKEVREYLVLVLNNTDNITEIIQNFDMFISSAKEISDVECLSSFKFMEMAEVNGANSSIIGKKVYDASFRKHYDEKNPIYINGEDCYRIFCDIANIKQKKKMILLAKSGHLGFYQSVYEILKKNGMDTCNFEILFEIEVSDKIYSGQLKNTLEGVYDSFIILFFIEESEHRRQKINKILEAENYQLLKDIVISGDTRFVSKINDEEINLPICSMKRIDADDLLTVINGYIFGNEHFSFDCLTYLKYNIKDDDWYNTFSNKHKTLLNLINSISYQVFPKMSIDEQIKLYEYAKALNDKEKSYIKNESKEIKEEIIKKYKEIYATTFTKADEILKAVTETVVEDSNKNKHNIKVYELKDDMPFTFLITVMNGMARDKTVNMYGRPKHKDTIEDPKKFCTDLRGGSDIISTSMINEKWIDTFIGPYADIMYIFSDIKPTDFVGISYRDASYPPKIDSSRDLFNNGNRDYPPLDPDSLMFETIDNKTYNEMAIRRKRENNEQIMPTAILCYDRINDASLKHAEYFNIPIIVIKTKTYTALSGFTPVITEDTKGHKK